MNAAKFYRKLAPDTQVLLSNGVSVKFNTLDLLTGYFSASDPFVQSEFARLMGEQRYGMSEISWDEFSRDFLQKKSNSQTQSGHVWREELTSRGYQSATPLDKLRALGGVVVAVEKSDIAKPQAVTISEAPACAPTMATQTPPIPAVPPKPFAPPVGKRAKRPSL